MHGAGVAHELVLVFVRVNVVQVDVAVVGSSDDVLAGQRDRVDGSKFGGQAGLALERPRIP